MFNKESFVSIRKELQSHDAVLVAVSKTKPVEVIRAVYDSGHRVFGENYVQEMVLKHRQLPKDIQWHFIGHLQTNKVKFIAPFVAMTQSVDSLKLLMEINKEGKKNERVIPCLLQIHIALEESKFGFSYAEAEEVLNSSELENMEHISIKGIMGMATLTDNPQLVRSEYNRMKIFYDKIKKYKRSAVDCHVLSMGMTGDYKIALEEGSNMVRIGSAIFGDRH